MQLNRTLQPPVLSVDKIDITRPVETTLPNGVPLYIINSGSQEVVRIDILFKGGVWHQSAKLQALFTNRMLREGTRKYTSAQIAEKLDYYGAWLELSSSLEHAYITLFSLNKYLAQTLEIVESLIKEPVFPEKELHTVIENNLQQFLINSAKVDFIAHRSLLSSLFGDSYPPGKLAHEEDYRNINRDMLNDFYRQVYHSGNCSIFLSGKVTESCVKLVENSLGKEQFGKASTPLITTGYPIVTTASKRVFTENKDAMQSAVKLGALTIDRFHPDHLKLRVLITLLGGYFGSRLMSNIREDKGFTYGISAGMFFYPGTGIIVIGTETTNEFVEPLIGEVYREIELLQNEKVTKEELMLVKNYMLGEMTRSYESAFSLADAWMFIHTSQLPESYFDDCLRAIKETTSDDILRLSCTYLNRQLFKEIVAGKNNL